MILVGFCWFGAASTLLWLTWNQVLVGLFRFQRVKLFQSMLVVGTLVVFLAPRWYMHRSMMKGCPYLRSHKSCCHSEKCHEAEDHAKDSDHEKNSD